MSDRYHTCVIGGGLLGVSAAIALQRRLNETGAKVLLIEQRTIGAGLSGRHSGIVRSAHRSAQIASWGMQANGMWRELDRHWGVGLPTKVTDALWIAPPEKLSRWHDMSQQLRTVGVEFNHVAVDAARRLSSGMLALNDNESVFHETQCLLIDPGQLREAMCKALSLNGVDCLMHTSVVGLGLAKDGRAREIHTTNGAFEFDHLVNAAGAWSHRLFREIVPNSVIEIPVSMERVFCANFLADPNESLNNLPLIADYQNDVYIRQWPGAQFHMHAPRSRSAKAISRCFNATQRGDVQDNAIYDSSSKTSSWVHAADFANKLRSRIPSIHTPTQISGEFSYFDITPDLGFILGPDTVIPNLHHNLGAGEAMKFAPALGEVIADSVLNDTSYASEKLLRDYSIARFRNQACNAAPLRNVGGAP